MLAAAARRSRQRADFLVLCTNTMHKVAPAIEAAVRIPLLHIADATAVEIRRAGLRRVGLLGTRFTMEQDFYRRRLEDRTASASSYRMRRIAKSCTASSTTNSAWVRCVDSRDRYREIIGRLVDSGAEGIISAAPKSACWCRWRTHPKAVFDTTAIHAANAVEFALQTP
jgi:aspartate racemase